MPDASGCKKLCSSNLRFASLVRVLCPVLPIVRRQMWLSSGVLQGVPPPTYDSYLMYIMYI